MMSWEQLAILVDEEHEIGSYSISCSILPLCNDQSLQLEIFQSRHVIQQHLNVSITSFCYPNGDADERCSVRLIQEVGYCNAVTTKWGRNKKTTPFFLLKCFDIQSQTRRSQAGDLSISRLAWRISPYFPMGI